jgi:hypothetical protein
MMATVIPGGKIGRQQSPLTTRSGTVEDGVQHFPDVDRSLLARPLLLRNMRCNERKFLVGQIAWIARRDALVDWYVIVARCHERFLRITLL